MPRSLWTLACCGVILGSTLATRVAAQTITPAPTRAGDVLSFEDFRQRVLANHPELTQLRNEQEQARRLITVAKGSFDPKLSGSISSKRYSASPYYTFTDAALTVPTFVGADFKLGFERGIGPKINPERSTSSPGLLSLGVSIPLGRDMITDERRTQLARARAVSDIADAELLASTNKLLLSATKAFADWYLAYRRAVIADSGASLAEFRRQAVEARVIAGESAAVDSVEARLEVNRRRITILEAQNDERSAALEAAQYLWGGRASPNQLPSGTVPALPAPRGLTDTTALGSWMALAQRTHPAVLKAEGKLALETADLRLNRQGVLPDVDVFVGALSSGSYGSPLVEPSGWSDNYKGSATASTSLLLRKERGKLAASALKVESARLERTLEQRRVSVEIQTTLNTLVMIEGSLQLQRDIVASSGLLRDAEEARFLAGESTLLAVNLRERSLLDEVIKLEQLQAKLLSANVALANARGVPPQ